MLGKLIVMMLENDPDQLWPLLNSKDLLSEILTQAMKTVFENRLLYRTLSHSKRS